MNNSQKFCECTQRSLMKPISETEYECFDCGKEIKQPLLSNKDTLDALRDLYTNEQIIEMWKSATPHLSFESKELKEDFHKKIEELIIWGTSEQKETLP